MRRHLAYSIHVVAMEECRVLLNTLHEKFRAELRDTVYSHLIGYDKSCYAESISSPPGKPPVSVLARCLQLCGLEHLCLEDYHSTKGESSSKDEIASMCLRRIAFIVRLSESIHTLIGCKDCVGDSLPNCYIHNVRVLIPLLFSELSMPGIMLMKGAGLNHLRRYWVDVSGVMTGMKHLFRLDRRTKITFWLDDSQLAAHKPTEDDMRDWLYDLRVLFPLFERLLVRDYGVAVDLAGRCAFDMRIEELSVSCWWRKM
jgi:hypothetical protein